MKLAQNQAKRTSNGVAATTYRWRTATTGMLRLYFDGDTTRTSFAERPEQIANEQLARRGDFIRVRKGTSGAHRHLDPDSGTPPELNLQ